MQITYTFVVAIVKRFIDAGQVLQVLGRVEYLVKKFMARGAKFSEYFLHKQRKMEEHSIDQ